MANKILNLDFSKDPIMPPIIYGRVGDEKMQTITVKISRRDEIPDLSGGVITFEGEPAGGKVKVFDSENVSSNNAGLQKGTFEYTFPSAAFSVEGTYKRAYFSFQKDGKRDTTGDFKIIVKGTADIDAEESETIITEYNKLVTALNEAYQAALEKIDTDYDAVVARIESIKTEMKALQEKIDKTVSDAEGRISKVATDSETKITTIGKTVTDAMNTALEELRAADFYTRVEADKKFTLKGDVYTKQESDEKYMDLNSEQEITGVKNFKDGIKIIGKEPVLTNAKADYAMVDKDNNASVMSAGSLKLYRRGDLVYLTGSFQLSALKDNQAIWFSIPTWAYPIEAVRIYGKTSDGKMCLIYMNPADNANIVCVDNVAKGLWITISGCWMAKNPY